MTRKNILVAALDWGLGHATRLIPVINALNAQHCNVILASSGSAFAYWQLVFPNEKIIELPAYNPVYGGNMNFSMILQTPKFLKAIYAENILLKKIVKQHCIHGIISDNRYGLYHDEIPSVLITHQLFIQAPNGLSFLKPILKQINFTFINKFNYCWIPDIATQENLSGILSHGENISKHCRYVGWLSRFQHEKLSIDYDLLLLLSGPEPLRSVLEEKILKQLINSHQRVVLVRGTNQPFTQQNILSEKIKVIDIATTEQLQQLLNQSAVVVARSGYSTVMDLVATQKPAVLIPTPGQTEQEYLANYLQEKQWFVSAAQNDFSLKDLLPEAMKLQPNITALQTEFLLNDAVDEFLGGII
jgi:predicted glycosyltransferase